MMDDTSSPLASSSLPLPLQIIQEAALTQYHDALQRWEKEKERQRYEFIITDKKLSQFQPVLVDEVVSHIAVHSSDDDMTKILSIITPHLVTGTWSGSSKKRATIQKT